MLKLRRAAREDRYLAMAIVEMDALLKERDEARRLAEHWEEVGAENGVYSEAAFPWQVTA